MKKQLMIIALLGVTLLFVNVKASTNKSKTVPIAPASPATEEKLLKQELFGEDIDWQVISSGGTNGSSASYTVFGTIGQTTVGTGSSLSFRISHGYWQSLEDTEPGTCGDVEASGGIDIDDIGYLISYAFQGGPEPIPVESGDVNCSDGTDINDSVYLVSYLFQGGYAPSDPNGNGLPDC